MTEHEKQVLEKAEKIKRSKEEKRKERATEGARSMATQGSIIADAMMPYVRELVELVTADAASERAFILELAKTNEKAAVAYVTKAKGLSPEAGAAVLTAIVDRLGVNKGNTCCHKPSPGWKETKGSIKNRLKADRKRDEKIAQLSRTVTALSEELTDHVLGSNKDSN